MAKTTPMIAFARVEGRTTVHRRGPETRTTAMTCAEGSEFFGVELRVGAYLPIHPPTGLANMNDVLLPTLTNGRLLLNNRG